MNERSVAYRKNGNLIEFRGTVNSTNATDLTMFHLPAGCRPDRELQFRVETEMGEGIVTVSPDGSVLATPGVGRIRLDGIAFEFVDED